MGACGSAGPNLGADLQKLEEQRAWEEQRACVSAVSFSSNAQG